MRGKKVLNKKGFKFPKNPNEGTKCQARKEETLLLRTLYDQNQTFGFHFLKTLMSDTKI